MKRTRSIHTPNLEAHRELSASPVPIQAPEAVKTATPLDASLFKGWKPNPIQRLNQDCKEKEFKSPLKTTDTQSKVTHDSRPGLPQFKPTELMVPGFENIAVTMPSEERIQLYNDLRGNEDISSKDMEKKKAEHEEEVSSKNDEAQTEAPIETDASTTALLQTDSSKTQEGSTTMAPSSQSQNSKRLVYEPPRKTELEDLNGERISTLSVKMFKNEVIQEHPGFGNRAKFRLTVNRVGLIEIYGKISKILESPTETIPRLVILITDESSEDPLEAYYYVRHNLEQNKSNLRNNYLFYRIKTLLSLSIKSTFQTGISLLGSPNSSQIERLSYTCSRFAKW